MKSSTSQEAVAGPSKGLPMELEEYERYGRQMIMPDCGLPGQLALRNARVAVIGAGGLGCPVLQYLAGAGVGHIDIYDHDTVSASNLHRQILHTAGRVGMNKAQSACVALKALNPLITVVPHEEPITPDNGLNLIRGAQILVDCTDRPLTRYLINDIAVRLGIPLVSGAAISGAGQWSVYGGSDFKGKKRACYRCIWPSVLPGSNGRCEDVGVWGFVTGMIGVGMASEVIKLITGRPDGIPLLHMYHLGNLPLMRSIKMKGPSPKCIACGPEAILTDDLNAFHYDTFCGEVEVDESTGLSIADGEDRIAAKDLSHLLDDQSSSVRVIDTRSETEFGICAISNAKNIPLPSIIKSPGAILLGSEQGAPTDVVFICKQGNDSRLAASTLRGHLEATKSSMEEGHHHPRIRDVRGGLRAWAKHVDPSFPLY